MTSYEALPFVHPFSGQDAGELLRARAAARGPHPLLIWAPFDAPVRTWSYAEFAHDVACVAGGLLKRGIRPKDRILVHFENCPETLIARFACMWIGAIAVLSNAALAGPELRDVVEAAGVRDVLTKNLGTSNPHNVVRAAMTALEGLRNPSERLRELGRA